mmetsp:Transcript_17008/g.24230  ORF Transcript_17008/g.24230 Transcript_17008/m.24230 type:complete len:431 (-) Transcript_17008:313-1605(-)
MFVRILLHLSCLTIVAALQDNETVDVNKRNDHTKTLLRKTRGNKCDSLSCAANGYCLNLHCSSNDHCRTLGNNCDVCVSGLCQQQLQNCGHPCNTDLPCGGSCNRCVNNVCSRPPSCGTPCSNDSMCHQAINGCTMCFQSQCQNPNNIQTQCGFPCNVDSGCQQSSGPCDMCVNNICIRQPQCGENCNSDRDCFGGTRGCSSCIGRKCMRPFCGSSCLNDASCSGAETSCTTCLGSFCQNPGNRAMCFSPCFANSDCLTAPSGCTNCIRGRCEVAPFCVSNEEGLRSAMRSSNSVLICANAQITITSTIQANTWGAFSLSCAGGTCIINGNSSFSLVQIFASGNVNVNGITFQNGSTNGNGGGLSIVGPGMHSIISCRFFNNRAQNGRGGAAYISERGYTLSGNRGEANSAARCSMIYTAIDANCHQLPM